MPALIAQIGASMIAYYVMWIIIVAAVIAIMYVILQRMGVSIPPFIVTIFWIIVAAIVGILAIKLLVSLV